jgi:acyl-CoA reductase-like NAD-dependent aldehyde dehydrogenase
MFVQEEIYETFIEKLKNYANALVVGDSLDPKTQFGPVVSLEHYKKIKSYIEIARQTNLEIVCGETVNDRPSNLNPNGYFVLPTIIKNVPDSSQLMQDEIFGPVVCVTSFKNEDEAIERANNSRYGLAATIWTKDIGCAHRVAQSLHVGTTWINTFLVRDLNLPFGGMKESGSGREGYPYSIDFFTELKTICVYHG